MLDKLKQHWKLLFLVFLVSVGMVLTVATYLSPKYGSPSLMEHPTPLRAAFEAAPQQWLNQSRDFSAFEADLNSHAVSQIGVNVAADSSPLLFVTLKDGTKYATAPVTGVDGLQGLIAGAGVRDPVEVTRMKVDLRSPAEHFNVGLGKVLEACGRLLAIALPLALLVFFVRQFGTQPKGLLAEKPTTRFADVIGVSEAKSALAEVVAFMRDPSQFERIGARAPRGILLEGPPGTGKTLLARALAGECGANFIAIDGSYFSSMFYEQGIKRVTALFKAARANAPCVIFIDEIDGIGARSSGPSRGNGQGEENRIINRLLVELDGFSASEDIVVIAATNHRENMDSALLRPGRFDQLCQMTLPISAERSDLFAFYLKPIAAANDIALEHLARASAGMSPADIAQVVNRAALIAAEAQALQVTQGHLMASLESMQLGGRVSSVKSTFSESTRTRIAVHEAGHALVAHLAGAGQVGRISIEPRGPALGVTFVSRDDETPLYGESELNGRLAMMLAGREAELMVYQSTTSGAADDLKNASSLAMRMVTELGFSREFGVMSFSGIAAEFMSAQTKERALAEARSLLTEAQIRCRDLLTQNRVVLQSIAEALVVHETLSAEQFRSLISCDIALAA